MVQNRTQFLNMLWILLLHTFLNYLHGIDRIWLLTQETQLGILHIKRILNESKKKKTKNNDKNIRYYI